MAAPLGFKTFTTGEVLTAADTNGYLMQGVLVFADAAARSAAITSPQEGQTSYLKDTDVIQVYSGSAWVTKSGTASPLTTKGDLYTYSTTDARLGVGTNGQVLTADSTASTGLAWATASSGGMTLITEAVLSASSGYSFTSIPQTYKQLLLFWSGIQHSTTGGEFGIRLNSNSSAIYNQAHLTISNSAASASTQQGTYIQTGQSAPFGYSCSSTDPSTAQGTLLIDNYTSTTKFKRYDSNYGYRDNESGTNRAAQINGTFASTTEITSIDIVRLYSTVTISNVTNTSVRLYGVS